MNDHMQGVSGALTDQDIVDLTQRPSDAFNEVVLQADYTTRAALSFYRFRQLGGDYHLPSKRKRIKETPDANDPEAPQKYHHRKLKLGESTGRGVHYISSHPKVPLFQLSIIALMISSLKARPMPISSPSRVSLASLAAFSRRPRSRSPMSRPVSSLSVIGACGTFSMPLDLENIFSRRNLYVLMGLIAIIVGLSLVFLVNLSAAHYRNILDMQALGQELPADLPTKVLPHFIVDPAVCEKILSSPLGETIGSAATNAMCRPFALHSLDAMVLFALGLAIAAFAAFEGRRLDSPFPGFSDSAAAWNAPDLKLRDALYMFEDSYEDIKEEVVEVKGSELTPKRKC